MLSILKNIGLEPIIVKKPATKDIIQGKKIYETGKMRYNSMLYRLMSSRGGSYLKNLNIDIMVLGGISGNHSRMIYQVGAHNKISTSPIKVYMEDDFLILLGEERFYLENLETGTFAYCHQDLYYPSNCLIQRGKIGDLGLQVSVDAKEIKALLAELENEGYVQKEVPDKWDMLRKFFLMNKGARQNKKKITRIKITEFAEFNSLVDYGISLCNLISHSIRTEYLDTLEHLIIVGAGYRSTCTVVPKVLEGFENLRTLELHEIKLEKLELSVDQLKKLRVLNIGNPKGNYWKHKLKSLPKSIFNSKSLLRLYFPETSKFNYTASDKEALKKMFISNALHALYHKVKKDRDLALSVLVENIANPLREIVPNNTIFVSSGKIKGITTKQLVERFKELDLHYIADPKTIDPKSKAQIIAIIGDRPKENFIEQCLQENWKLALGGMVQDFLREQKKQLQLSKEGEVLNEDLKENLEQLLGHQDKENIKLAIEIASSKEIQKETTNFDDLATDWLMLAMFGETASIRNRSKTQLKNHAAYEINDFIKNKWHGRIKKDKQQTIEVLKLIIDHPKVDKKKVIAALEKEYYSNYSKPTYTDVIIHFVIKQGLIDYLSDDVKENLNSLNIKGDELTEDLLKFKNIRYITISSYSSKIEINEIPEGIIEFDQLTDLNISGTKVKDLPMSLSKCKNIRNIRLYSNQLEVFPQFIFHLPNVRELILQVNLIEHIPKEIGQLKKLERLQLSEIHREKGTNNNVLQYIGGLTQLRELSLSHIHRTELYEHLHDLKNLQSLTLNYCTYEQNHLLSFLKALPKLRYVYGLRKQARFIKEALPNVYMY